MLKLTRENYRKAEAYIFSMGRSLDQALFRLVFEDGSLQEFVDALSAYQNPDGGFGNALEPDIRASTSSAVATQAAFDYLHTAGVTKNDLIQKAITYLVQTFDSDNGVWPIIPPEVEDAPHAPWWSYEDSAKNFDNFKANPSAALTGYLHLYSYPVPGDILSQATEQALAYLESLPLQEIGMHDMFCFLTLAAGLPAPRKEIILNKLRLCAPFVVEQDPSMWTEYNMRPLWITPRPDSDLFSALDPTSIEANLDYEIEEQLDDGSWPLTWSWEFIDADAWAQAEKDWKGHHTVRKLMTFKAYGRLD